MAEYLAPGVYVEEIPSANKPIQAAGTSTAGMVGMTARGPVGRPELVTSLGAYNRLFGSRLDPLLYPPGHALMPFAVEGFFANGGARLYVVRVVGDDFAHSAGTCHVPPPAAATTVLRAPVATGATSLVLTSVAGFAATDRLVIGDEQRELATIALPDTGARHVLHTALEHAFAATSTATLQLLTLLAPVTTAAAAAGTDTLIIDDAGTLAADTDLLLSSADGTISELIRLAAVDTAGNQLTLAGALLHDYPVGSTLTGLADSANPAEQTTLASRALAGMDPGVLELLEPSVGSAGDILRLDDAGTSEVVRVDTVAESLSLQAPLQLTHEAGGQVSVVEPALQVHARWPGQWGDALRFAVRPAALAATALAEEADTGQDVIRVHNALGIHPGTVLVFSPAGVPATVDTERATAVVQSVEQDSGSITLSAALTSLQPVGTRVTSREFTVQVDLMDGRRATQSETFANLSLNPAHPNYAPDVIGAWQADDNPAQAGGSELIRVVPQGPAPTAPVVAGIEQFLTGGDDDAAGVGPEQYVGTAAVDPQLRSGIQALENEPTLSIVAVPGITDLTVQKALVAHCEKMRYRFAVLDVPSGARLAEARAHRQNFDTTRAALYYPDLQVNHPFAPAGTLLDIPPSGHVMGIYARTDTTRGVHKAPANEVVVAVLGLHSALTKGEQDILNPINLNVIRDFRSENRGIRVYGARVATSDPEFKYVNVRRLLLFIEQSLDAGLQWAVFEPNDTALWDAVRQSVTGFLDTVWRSGALEGTKQSEAFFVNIGYNVTMSQADIDNGLLVIEIGVAAVKPAEFVVVRISQKTREATA